MHRKFTLFALGCFVLFSHGAKASPENNKPTVVTLDNGLQVMLLENHSNPMIAGVVVIKAGLRNETRSINGVSHFLEHLLFNGTQRRTQKQLYDEQDFYGGYFNAHTDEDYTNFLFLISKEYIDQALDLQADMLFNSNFPEDKLEKERGIVIEEIGKDRDQESYVADQHFRSQLFRGTPYAMPVLGTPATIGPLSRAQVWDYYRRYYVPNNMVALFIGDFETPEMLRKVEKYFGEYPPGDLLEEKPISPPRIKAGQVSILEGRTSQIHLNLALLAPKLDDPDYPALELLNQILGSGEGSRLDLALKTAAKPLVHSVSSHYTPHRDFAVMTISATLPTDSDIGGVTQAITRELRRLAMERVSPEELRAVKVRMKAEEIALFENLHYYALSRSIYLALADPDFLTSRLGKLDRVTPEDLRRVAARYFSQPQWMATALVPPTEVPEDRAKAPTASAVERRVFGNGLTLIVKENPDSRVFAVHVLAKNRAFKEPRGKDGIADFLHRMLLQGTQRQSAADIRRELRALGAQLKVVDDPNIPYDDYYTSPLYSYVRLETMDEFHERGLELLADLIRNPKFEAAGVEVTRREMTDLVKKRDASARETARRLFSESLFAGHPLGTPITGNLETLSSITSADVVEFHRRYFAPNNLIVTVVSPVPAEKILTKTQALFGEMGPSAAEQITPTAIPTNYQAKRVRVKMGKEQSYLCIGNLFPSIEVKDVAALWVMNALLSSEISFNLREKRGLAYSTGSDLYWAKGMGWLMLFMGTRPANLEQAERGLLEEVKKLKERLFEPREVERIINKELGRQRMRRLTSINQAYYLAMAEFLGGGYGEGFLETLKSVKPEDVQRVARQYLPSEEYVTVTVE